MAAAAVPLVVLATKVLGPGRLRLRMVKLRHNLDGGRFAMDTLCRTRGQQVRPEVRSTRNRTRVAAKVWFA